MSHFSDTKVARARPYWLLFALALFIAGQFATAAHWHDEGKTLDADCALCALSSAAGAAIAPDTPTIASVVVCAFFFIEVACIFISRHTRIYNSRAPPFYS
ncbi:MAG TPA: hypothetical protein VFM32_01470 [Spongiibacteraceae bacterium]|nr:hypothetical protein [Spongiibacteraceae bacterium]